MKKTVFKAPLALLFMIALLAAVAGCSNTDVTASEQPAAAAKHSPTDVAVTVNNSTLTYGEIQQQMDAQLEAIKGQIPPEQMAQMQPRLDQMREQMQGRIIESFVTKTILAQEADRLNISISDEELNAKLKEFEESLPGDMTLENALKMSGTTLDIMREEVRFGMRAEKLIDSQVPAAPAPDADEIKQYYETNKKKFETPESVRARHILLKTSETDNATVKASKKAALEGIRKELVGGADFAKLAKEKSDCPSRERGGDLGTFSRGKMVKQFEDAAFSQKVNEIGPVVESRFGYHLIQTLEHTPASTQSLDQVRDTIIDSLDRKKKNDAIQQYITGLQGKATITYGSSAQ
jgi:peptidyl-prolyl cis-trans isomerase C